MGTKKILLVEDNITDVLFVRYVLEEDGFQVIVENDGISGLEAISSEVVDFILIDLQMPQMSGLELLETIKRQPRFENIPAIILTSSDSESDKSRAFKLGACAFLTKPISRDDLRNTPLLAKGKKPKKKRNRK